MVDHLPHPADLIVAQLQAGLSQLDPHWLQGVYLTGSIPLGDFQPQKSDVDFLILCHQIPADEVFTQVKRVHQVIRKAFPKPQLNGVYLSIENLLAHNLSVKSVLHLHEGTLARGLFDMGPVTLFELKTIAHTLTGISANQLPIDITIGQVNDFMYENIQSYWQPWIHKHTFRIDRKGLLALFPVLTEWAVLGVARQVYTLQTGKIGSKKEAGQHCLAMVPTHYQAIIQEGLHIRANTPSRPHFSLKNLYTMAPSWTRAVRTIDCVHYLIDLFNTGYRSQKI